MPPDPVEAGRRVREVLATGRFDAIVLGGSLRVPASRVLVFEALVNLLRREAPDTPLAFNTSPEDSADAAVRAATSSAASGS